MGRRGYAVYPVIDNLPIPRIVFRNDVKQIEEHLVRNRQVLDLGQMLTTEQCNEFMRLGWPDESQMRHQQEEDGGEEEEKLVKHSQRIEPSEDARARLWDIVSKKLGSAMIHETKNDETKMKGAIGGAIGLESVQATGLMDAMTWTRATRPLARHVDGYVEGSLARFKLLVFLSEMPSSPSGTQFYADANHPEHCLLIPHEQGRAIIFDITLEHASQPFPPGQVKYMLGARLDSATV